MPLTEQQLLQILPNARPVAGIFVPALNRAMNRFKITGRVRQAAFIAQAGHESLQLRRLVENLNYSAQGLATTWPSRFAIDRTASPQQPNAQALALARIPEAIANAVYDNRADLGNVLPGDGWRYRGRGLIQLTGKANYRAAGQVLGLDLIADPGLLEQPEQAALSAAWFWSSRGLNELADAGRFTDITRRINTGLVGLRARQALQALALEVLV